MFLDQIAVAMCPTTVFEFDECDVKNEEIFEKLSETSSGNFCLQKLSEWREFLKKQATHDLSTKPNDMSNETEVNNELSRGEANDREPSPGIANNDVQTSASIVSQDIVNKDDSTTDNILQPQSTQPALLIEEHTNHQNTDDNVEAKFLIADDESSKSSVAEKSPTKKPLGQAIEHRRKKNL